MRITARRFSMKTVTALDLRKKMDSVLNDVAKGHEQLSEMTNPGQQGAP
jgi:hypothetical protein